LVVGNEATFPDVTNQNWGKEYIETLASKYIIDDMKPENTIIEFFTLSI